MPSIFEKPSILGFRAECGDLDTKRWVAAKRSYIEAARKKAQELGVDITEILFNESQLTGNVPGASLADQLSTQLSESRARPVFQQGDGQDVSWRDVASALSSETPESLARFIQPTQPTPTAAPVTPAAPAATPSMFGEPTSSIFAPSLFGEPAPPQDSITASLAPLDLSQPTSRTPSAAPPAGTRAERVAAAIASGDFAEKQRQYNQEAMRMGSPTMMDAQGNIVGRELTEAERMREFFKTTGGNTMFSQTTDPAQRALQNEMMKQARAQATVNAFGTTPSERLANLQAATDARKIPQPPLSSDVREVAPGVRAAFKDGQRIGFGTNQAPTKGPNGESTATANAPKTPSVETFASMFPDTGLRLALASPVSNAPTSAPAPVAAPAASPAVNAGTTKLMEQVNQDPEVMRATKALASSRAQSAADAPQIAALNAYRDQMNQGVGALDSAMATDNDPMVMGMFPPASTGQNQRDSAEAADSLDAAQAAYESIMGKKPMSSAPPAPTARVAPSPAPAPTARVAASPVAAADSMAQFLGASPTASSTAAGDLKAVRDAYAQMFGNPAPTARVAPAGYSAFSPQSRPTSAFSAEVSAPPPAKNTGAKGTRKALGGDKPRNQRARK